MAAWPTIPQAELDRKPWKYTGYPGLSTFLSADKDRLVVRRFDELHSRIILIIQDEISQLEEELKALDTNWRFRTDEDLNNGTIRGECPARKEILDKIRIKLKEHDTSVLQYSSLLRLPQAPKRSISNLQTWLFNNNGCINDNEAQFIKHTDDLVSFQAKPRSILREYCDPWLAWLSRHHLPAFKATAPSGTGPMNEATVFSSNDDVVDRFVSIAIFAVGLSLLVTQLWILQAVSNLQWKLGVITLFLVIFLLILSLATTGTPNQIIAATAGYAAVLVVFLQQPLREVHSRGKTNLCICIDQEVVVAQHSLQINMGSKIYESTSVGN